MGMAGGTSEGSGEDGAALKGGARRGVARERPRGIAGGGERLRGRVMRREPHDRFRGATA